MIALIDASIKGLLRLRIALIEVDCLIAKPRSFLLIGEGAADKPLTVEASGQSQESVDNPTYVLFAVRAMLRRTPVRSELKDTKYVKDFEAKGLNLGTRKCNA